MMASIAYIGNNFKAIRRARTDRLTGIRYPNVRALDKGYKIYDQTVDHHIYSFLQRGQLGDFLDGFNFPVAAVVRVTGERLVLNVYRLIRQNKEMDFMAVKHLHDHGLYGAVVDRNEDKTGGARWLTFNAISRFDANFDNKEVALAGYREGEPLITLHLKVAHETLGWMVNQMSHSTFSASTSSIDDRFA